MTNFVVTGVSSATLSRGAKSGRYIKVCSALYLTREPTPHELLTLLVERYPGPRVTGPTAAQIYLGQELSFPLHVAHRSQLPQSPYFHAYRTKKLKALVKNGFAIHIPCLAAERLDDATATTLLETFYARRDGPRYLKRHNEGVRFSPRVRSLIELAALGTDSEVEKILSHALTEAGLRVTNNVRLGAYYWDIVIPELNVIVEIDGFSFHTSDNRLTFAKDRWKGNDATLAGYILLRYSGSCIVYELPRVVDQILSVRERPVPMPEHGVWTWHWLFVREADQDQYTIYSS